MVYLAAGIILTASIITAIFRAKLLILLVHVYSKTVNFAIDIAISQIDKYCH